MKKLPISPDLSLPVDAVTQALAFLGRRRSGKTYAAMKLFELMHGAGAQAIAMDGVGVWWGLRLAADGKTPSGLDVPVFGGLNGDIPLEASGGKLIADVIVDRGISAVVDVSQFESDADRVRFATDFGKRFFYRKASSPSAVHVFVEECQDWVPQNPQGGEEKMLHAWQRMMRLGGNYGIGMSLISQRPQDVHKKALNQAECIFAFQLTGTHERKALELWISSRGLDVRLSESLPDLQQGHAHVWSPVWLNINREVAIGQRDTFAAGSTPKVGEKARAPRPLSPIDLERLQGQMAEAIKKAKADDPKELRATIARLEAELRKAATSKPAPAASGKASGPPDRAAIDRAVAAAVTNTVRGAQSEIALVLKPARRAMEKVFKLLRDAANHLESALPPESMTLKVNVPVPPPAPARAADQIERRLVEPDPTAAGANGRISKGGRRLLTALAQFGTCSDTRVAALTGLSAGAGHFGNTLSELRKAGFITGERSALEATPAGLEALGPYELLPTGDELLQYWYAKLGKGAASILRELVEAYPDSRSDEEIAAAQGMSAKAGHFGNCLSELRVRDLVTGERRALRASEELF